MSGVRSAGHALADYAGRLIDEGSTLDGFIEQHRENWTLLEKVRDVVRSIVRRLSGAERRKAQTAEGKLTAALEAVIRQVKPLQGKSTDDTMVTMGDFLKEDSKDGRESEIGGGLRAGGQGKPGQTLNGEGKEESGQVHREFSTASERHRGINPSFGAKLVRSWAEGYTVEPGIGSAAYVEQQTAMDYGVPSFVVADTVWAENTGKTPAFSVAGQIYFRETLPEISRGMFAPHEITHVMRQLGYQPYLDFVERTPTMLNMSDQMTHALLEHVAEHQHTTLEDADPARLYDEFNATVYGHIAAGKADMFTDGPAVHMFHDFAAYAEELGALHERFKADNHKATSFSLKEDMGSKRYAAIPGENELPQEYQSLFQKAGRQQGQAEYWKGGRRRAASGRLRTGVSRRGRCCRGFRRRRHGARSWRRWRRNPRRRCCGRITIRRCRKRGPRRRSAGTSCPPCTTCTQGIGSHRMLLAKAPPVAFSIPKLPFAMLSVKRLTVYTVGNILKKLLVRGEGELYRELQRLLVKEREKFLENMLRKRLLLMGIQMLLSMVHHQTK